ncbi:MAG: hypothetical protein ACJ73S_01515 [Mycobacteriales bacterium]
MATPDSGSGNTAYEGMALDSGGRLWVAGHGERGLDLDTDARSDEQLLHRWDGSQWTAIPAPRGTQDGSVTPSQAVAAATQDDVWVVGSLIQRWHGGQWTAYPHPDAGPFHHLNAVAAVSPTDVWAVGQQTSGALVDHWDGTGWREIPVGNVAHGKLTGLLALSSTDVWAVGTIGSHSLTLHWDGRFWSTVPSPDVVGARSTELRAVAGASPGDLWAVGTADNSTTVAMHWDGTRWTVVPSPSPAAHQNQLDGVTVTPAGDAWAVGNTNGAILTEHWDGSTWTAVPGPPTTRRNEELYQVVARSATDVVAVGRSDFAGLVARWDGASWQVVRTARAGYGDQSLADVSTLADTTAWAVGTYHDGALRRPLAQHWDGAAWRRQDLPLPVDDTSPNGAPKDDIELHGISARADDDVWAVGEAGLIGGLSGSYRTLVYHWDGTRWQLVPSPNPHGTGLAHRLYSVVAVGPSDVWAVGEYELPGQGSNPLALHWDGTSWHEAFVPPGPNLYNPLLDVTAAGAGGLWAVGSSGDVFAGTRPIARRYQDGQWQDVPLPVTEDGRLASVSAVSATDAWAVGDHDGHPLLLRWDGTAWTVAAQPLASADGRLDGVAAVSATQVWAVGGDGGDPVSLRWDGQAWTQVPVPAVNGTGGLHGVAGHPGGLAWVVGEASRDHLNVDQPLVLRMPTAT